MSPLPPDPTSTRCVLGRWRRLAAAVALLLIAIAPVTGATGDFVTQDLLCATSAPCTTVLSVPIATPTQPGISYTLVVTNGGLLGQYAAVSSISVVVNGTTLCTQADVSKTPLWSCPTTLLSHNSVSVTCWGRPGAGVTCSLVGCDSNPLSVAFESAALTVNENAGTVALPVVLSRASTQTVTVTCTSSNGSALAGINFQPLHQTVTFSPGQMVQAVGLTLLDDHRYAGTLGLTVSLSDVCGGTVALGAPASEAVSIVNADPPPAVAFGSASTAVREDCGTVGLGLTLSAASGLPVSVAYAATPGTAVPGVNYLLAAGTITIPAGATTAAIPLAILHDRVSTPNLTCSVAIANPVGAVLAQPTSEQVTIDNIDPAGPSFVLSGNQQAYENSGGQVVPGFASQIACGGGGGSGQFLITDGSPALFDCAPTIDGSGTLRYTPAHDAVGTASLGVALRCASGTSASQGCTITILPVNQPPTFVIGPDQSVAEDAGLQTVVGWATAISPGPANEAAQTVTFSVTTTNPGLFAQVPALSSSGTLTYVPLPGAWGCASVQVVAHDDGGTAHGGCDTSAAQCCTITVRATPPVITSAASAVPDPVTATTTALAVTASDASGAAGLCYRWTTVGSPPAPVTFSAPAAAATNATFRHAGTYAVQVTVTDPAGLSATSAVSVSVVATATALTVTPPSAQLRLNATQAFTASVCDQFGNALSPQPAITWSTSGVGTIAGDGVYQSGAVAGSATITASAGAAPGVRGTATVAVVNAAPTVARAASAVVNQAQTQAALSVLGADDGGEANLIYTWSASSGGCTFLANGTNQAKASTVTFPAAGAYTCTVTITDAGGLSASSAVRITVNQVATSVAVTPASASLPLSGSQAFYAQVDDQFEVALTSQPSISWSCTGVGSITGGGLYRAGTSAGTATVTASACGLSGSATVSVGNAPPTVAQAATATLNPAGTQAALSVLGADDGGAAALTYSWSSTPASGVTITPNHANAAHSATMAMPAAGTYQLTCTITDAGGLSVTSSTTLLVPALLTAIQVAPATATVPAGGSQAFTANALDQFGLALVTQPSIAWSQTGVGAISSAGLFHAGSIAGTATVVAASGTVSGTAAVTVTASAPTVATPASAVLQAGGTTALLKVLGTDASGGADLTYAWSSSQPGVQFSANGTAAAQQATATLPGSGTYVFTATISAPGGLSVSSSATLVVGQQVTTIVVSPVSVALHLDAQQAFTAQARDQFGLAMATQPSMAWTLAGVGTIASSGLYASGANPGTATVTASAAGVSGSAEVGVTNAAPTVATAASATLNAGRTAAAVTVLGADDGGEANLTYSWQASPANVVFSPNASHAAQSATATFAVAGTYTLTATISDGFGLSATSSVVLTVPQVATVVAVAPASASVLIGGTQAFAAQASDQFGNPVTAQPSWTWTATGVGSISATGSYLAGTVSGTATVTATAGALHGSAAVTVTDQPPTVAQAAAAQLNAAGTQAALSVLGASGDGESSLTYTWSSTALGVTFAANGTNAAKATTATFSATGTAALTVTISDPAGASVTSAVTVVVPQVASSLSVAPATATVHLNASQAFSAQVFDQFSVPLATQPAVAWSDTGVGAISSAGLFQSASQAGTAAITAASVALSATATVSVVNAPPTVASAVTAVPSAAATGFTLTVLGADDGGAANLIYTWSATPSAGVTFSASGTAAAASSQATVSASGTYTFTAIITDAGGLTATSSAVVTLAPVPTTVVVAPSAATLHLNDQVAFSGQVRDQFGAALSPQPSLTWTATGVGQVSPAGLFASAGAPGAAVVTARSGSVSGTAAVTVVNAAPTVATAAAAVLGASATQVQLSVLGADDGGAANLTYAWSATPAGHVTFTANGSTAAANTTASIAAAGSYQFTVTISDSFGLTATSTATVNVPSSATALSVSPGTASLALNASQQFTAQVVDQFGEPLAPQPAIVWSLSGGGALSATGLFNSGLVPGTSVVTASAGTTQGTAQVTLANQSPTIATAPTAITNAAATGAALSVLGADDGGEAQLAYAWSAVPSAGVIFSANGTNAAKHSQVLVPGPGSYQLTVTIADAYGLTVSASVGLTVQSQAASLQITPAAVSLVLNAAQAFQATVNDQFAQALAPQPAVTWSATGVGAITAQGLYQSGGQPGAATVQAQADGLQAAAAVSVSNAAPTVASAAQAVLESGGTRARLSVLGADDGGEGNLTYTWSGPAGTVFTVNGTHAAQASEVTVPAAGSYLLTATIADAFGLTVTSSTTLVVAQQPTALAVAPSQAALALNAAQAFSAQLTDQFGAALAPQPSIAWAVQGVGTISAAGLYQSGPSPGSAEVLASADALTAQAGVTVANAAPTVAQAAAAQVGSTSVRLTVLGADDGGEANLTYTWSGPVGVSFSSNGSNAAKTTTASLTTTGAQTFLVTITDAFGLAATSSVVAVVPVLASSVSVTPAQVSLPLDAAVSFSAVVRDQFGAALQPQPAITWSVSGVGAISDLGAFQSGTTPGTATVTAQAGTLTGSAAVSVTHAAPAIVQPATAQLASSGTTALLAVLASSDLGEAALTYAWSSVPAGVSFSAAGSNAAKMVSAQFPGLGTYELTVTVTDPLGLATTSAVSVVVAPVITALQVSPSSVALSLGGTQTFSALALDQFATALAVQPSIAWSASGVGTITAAGVYTASAAGSATITASAAGLTASAQVTIAGTIPSLAFTAASLSIAKDGGTAVLTVALSAPSVQAVGATLVLGGTAQAGVSYSPPAQALTIPAGALSASIAIPILDDHRYDGTQTLSVQLTAPVQATLATPSTCLVTITESDPPPSLAFSGGALSVNASSGSVAVPIALSAAAGLPITALLTASGTAVPGADVVVPATITIPAGASTAVIPIQLLNDAAAPGDKTLVLTLQSASPATIGEPSFQTIAIHDDLHVVQVAFLQAAQSVSEDAGVATLTVALSAATVQPVAVAVQASGAGASDAALGPVPSSVTIAPGQQQAEVIIPIADLEAVSLPEALVLTLANPQGAALGAISSCKLTITDTASVALTPILQYVQPTASGAAVAYFGYRNATSAVLGVPIGADNRLVPGTPEQGQAVIFPTGSSDGWPDCAFAVPFVRAATGSGLTWDLAGGTAAAALGTPAPPAPPAPVVVSDQPTVTILSPLAGAAVSATGSLTVSIDAYDAAGTLTQVVLDLDGTPVATIIPQPVTGLQAVLGTLAPGPHVLTAIATNLVGASTSSAPVAITVQGVPLITLSDQAPAPLVSGEGITLTAQASEPGGAIAQVVFQLDGVPVATLTQAPYTTTVAAAAGSHSYTAIASDALQQSAQAQVTLSADTPPLVQLSSPSSGQLVVPSQGTIPLMAVAGDATSQVATVSFQVNGVSVGTISSPPYRLDWVPTSAGALSVVAIATDTLGVSRTSSPVVFSVAAPPAVAITAPADGTVVALGAPLTIQASATAGSGQITSVMIQEDGERLIESQGPSATLTVTPALAGDAVFVAEVLDSLGNDILSPPIHVHVDAAPQVQITAPSAGTVLAYPGTCELDAAVQDLYGTISAVDFYIDGQWQGQCDAAPYQITAAVPAPGDHLLTATATDIFGFEGVSPSIDLATTGTTPSAGTGPTFQAGAPIAVLENAGAQAISGWATRIAPAAGGTSVSFQVTADNPALFQVQPQLDAAGDLSFTPASMASGSSLITVIAVDNGGTANGRIDASAPARVQIVVLAVNQAPSFTPGADQTVAAGAPAQQVAWATAISPGPASESWQTVAFQLSVDHPELFNVQPAISAQGVLSYTPASAVEGTASISVVLSDDGGTANGGHNQSGAATLAIHIVSSAATAFPASNDAWSYGSITALGAALVPYAELTSETPAGWNGPPLTVRDDASAHDAPAAILNTSAVALASGATVWPAGTLVLTPGPTGASATRWSVARWTAPTGGAYALSIGFHGIDPAATCDVHVLIDGQDVQPGTITGTASTSLSGTWQIEAGGTVECVVGPGSDGAGAHDLVALTATIAASPSSEAVSFVPAQVTVADTSPTTTLQAQLAMPSTQPITVPYSALDGSAHAGSDYLLPPGSLTFAAGTTSQPLVVGIGSGSGATCSFQVVLQPPAGVAAGAGATAQVTIAAVNHAPTFQIGDSLSVLDTAGAQVIPGWITAISPGPATESAQTVSFQATCDQPALFSQLPTIDAGGTLRFTPAPGAAGTTTLSVIAQDNGGTAFGGSDTSNTEVATIQVLAPQLSVGLAGPAAGATYPMPTAIALSALITDVGGEVDDVTYLVDGVPALAGAGAAWQATLTGLTPGSHTLAVQADDSQGLSARSAPVTIAVTQPLAITLTAPSAAAAVPVGQALHLAATVSDSAYAVAGVQFLVNGQAVGSASAAPWTLSWTPTALGTITIAAQARDDAGNLVATPAVTMAVHAVPSVTLAAVAAGSPSQPALALSATASEAGGTISAVAFYDRGLLLGSVAAAPYQLTTATLAAGTHALTAVATDGAGFTATSSVIDVTLSAVSAPQVAITAPSAGGTVVAGTAVTITAQAAPAATSTLSSVAFYANGQPLGTITSAPYAVTWTPAAPGSQALQAVATDADGTQALASITVSASAAAGGSALSVSLASPLAGSSWQQGTGIPLQAVPVDGAAAIASVQFLVGTTIIGEADAAPWTMSWTTAAPGVMQVSALATDASGATAVSAPIAITVLGGPLVTLAGAIGGTASQPVIDLTAAVVDRDGVVQEVAFYDDGQLLGTVASAPYEFTAANLPAGQHLLTAVASDDQGFSGTSNGLPFVLTIQGSPTVALTAPAAGALIAPGAGQSLQVTVAPGAGATLTEVVYYDNGAAVATATQAPWSATWSSTAIGVHALQAQATDSLGGSTVSPIIAVTVDQAPTIAWSQPSAGAVLHAPASLTLALTPTSSAGPATVVITQLGAGGGTVATLPAPPYTTTLVLPASGTYAFQATATDALGLSATSTIRQVTVITPAQVAITAPASGQVLPTTQPLTVAISASQADGEVASVLLLDHGVPIGAATTAPYAVTIAAPSAGSHAFSAVATDGLGLTTASAVVPVTLDTPPAIALSTPSPIQVQIGGQPVVLSATATAGSSAIAQVSFFDGATVLGTVTAAPWVYSWQGAAGGTHSITAIATDALGLSATSAALAVLVETPPVVAITSPLAGAMLTPGVATAIQVSAQSSGSTVSSVTVYADNQLIGTATSAPFAVSWTPAAGSHVLSAVALDAQGLTAAAPAVAVVAGQPSTGLAVLLTAPYDQQQLVNGATVPLQATARAGASPIASVTFLGDGQVLGLATAAPYAISWVNATTGSHVLTAMVTDTQGLTASSAPITIAVTANPPGALAALLSAPLPGLVAENEPLTLGVQLANAVGLNGIAFYQGTTLIAQGDLASGQGTWPSVPAGTWVLTARATAANGAAVSQAVTVTAAPDNGDLPQVAITAPADGDTVYDQVGITGGVASTNPAATISAWTLVASLNDGSYSQTIASGTAAATGLLTTWDTSLIPNNAYQLTLTATDSLNRVAESTLSVHVAGEAKVGRFSFSQQDLIIPVQGMPLAVVRTYDSLNQNRSADFGYGWNYALTDLDVTFDDVRTPTEDVSGGTFSLRTGGSRDITLTLPTGQRVTFTGIYDQGDLGHATLRYVAPPGTFAGLRTNPAEVIDEWPVGTMAPWWGDEDPNLPLDGLDVPSFTLTMPDGTAYLITRDDTGEHDYATPFGDEVRVHTYGAAHVAAINQANGNSLAIGANGITHYDPAGAATRSLLFQRDALGRISAIYAPSQLDAQGNPVGAPSFSYLYDALGNLIEVDKLDHLDAANQPVLDRTRFQLTNRDFPHYITTIIDPDGNSALRSEYDDEGRLIATVDALGHVTQINHDLADNLETVYDRLGNPTETGYDERGNVTVQIDPLGGVTGHTYDADNNVLTTTDPLGDTTTMTYDASGRVLTSTDPLGNVTSHTYDAIGDELTTTTPLGYTTTRTFDSGGHLLSETDPLGNTSSTTYDANGNAITQTDALGNVTQMAYDGNGNLISQTDALGNVTAFTYDGNGNQLTSTTIRTTSQGPVTMTTSMAYDAQNRVVSQTAADGSVTQTVYTPTGQIDHTVDALGYPTQMTYDSLGNLITTTMADGTTTQVSYDADARRQTSTDQAGHVTIYAYDADSRLTTTTAPDQSVTSTAYDAAGRVLTSTDALNHVTSYQYDADGRRIAQTNALNQVSSFAYDADGQQVSMTDALGRTWTMTFDADGRQTVQTAPDGTTTQTGYDVLGRKVLSQDQAGQRTAYAYDALGRLIEVTDALGQITAYSYDEVGNQVAQVDANHHVTNYAYDDLNRRLTTTLPAGQMESVSYDLDGRQVSRTDRNHHTTTMTYDAMGRLLSTVPDAFFNAETISYTYTATGQRQTMVDGTGESSYLYDSCNRLIQVANAQGTIGYTYDAAGDLLTTTSNHAGGAATTYTYDALNRLSTASDQWVGGSRYQYDANGNLASLSTANGVTTAYGYDTLNRLTSQSLAATASTLASYQYTLGAAGNRLSVAELGRSVTYGYDALYRLTSETVAGKGAVGYAYDAVGNRLTRSSTVTGVPTTTSSFDADDRLSSDQYDANGNTTESTFGGDVYDFADRLVQRTRPDHTVVLIAYDGDGTRVSETVAGVTTWFLVDGNNPTGYTQVLEEGVGSSVNRAYVYGLERIGQRLSTGLVNYFGTDGHGNVRQLVSSTGLVTDTYTYDAFGILIASTGSTFNRFLYCGEEWDANLNLYYNRARWMEPGRGRFWSMDTWQGHNEDPSSLHKYLYCENDPINCQDRNGHELDMLSILSSMMIQGIIGASLNVGFAIYNGDSLSQTLELAVIGFTQGALLGGIVKLASYLYWTTTVARYGYVANAGQAVEVAANSTSKVVSAIAKARASTIDCEEACFIICDDLGPDAIKIPIGGAGGVDHAVVDFGGQILDATASQYVKPGYWTAELLEQAGLTQAVETGIFTPLQHGEFMKQVSIWAVQGGIP